MHDGLHIVNSRNCESGEYPRFRKDNGQDWWLRCSEYGDRLYSVGLPAIAVGDGVHWTLASVVVAHLK